MSFRKSRGIVLTLIIAGIIALAPLPAQARESGWRDRAGATRQLRGYLGSFHKVLQRLFELSRGGMDPNG